MKTEAEIESIVAGFSRWFRAWRRRRFPKFRRITIRLVPYDTAHRMICESVGKPEAEQWVIAKEEDKNKIVGWVFLERRVRIT